MNSPFTRIHAGDPGIRNIVAVSTPMNEAYDGTDHTQINRRQFTRDEWYDRALINDLKRFKPNHHKRAQNQLDELQQLETHLAQNTLKSVTDSDSIIARSRVYLEVFERYFQIWNNHKYLKRKFFKFLRKKKELDAAVEYYLGFKATLKEPHIVGYGDWDQSFAPRGGKPKASQQRFRKYAEKRLKGRVIFVDINEYGTSKYVTCCFGQGDYMKRHVLVDVLEGDVVIQERRRRDISGLIQCTHCNKTLNRDKNVSDNMMKILMAELNKPLHPSVTQGDNPIRSVFKLIDQGHNGTRG